MSDHINELFDKDGNLIGALLSAEAWNAVKKQVFDSLGIVETHAEPEKPEPLADWETLKDYWDFDYPVDTDVTCEQCGNTTQDWAKDDPRRFRLTSANLAGLVAFKCMQCQSKVVKRHFKDELTTECTPYRDSKDTSKEGRYNR
nr:hypothetical protein [uncultured Pseudodesulfovibrio sp.]